MLDDHSKCLEAHDKKIQYKHHDVIIPYVAQKLTTQGKAAGISDKRNTWFAIRQFYDYHRCSLQPLRTTDRDKMFAHSELDDDRVIEERPLTLEEVHKLIMNSPLPYSAVLLVMLQGSMAEEEFIQFNRGAWKQIVDRLDKPGPIEIHLFRSKTSRGSRGKLQAYVCFISEDARNAIKDWIKIRPKAATSSHLFVTWRKGGGRMRHKGAWVPITADLIGKNITKVALRTGMIVKGVNGASNRYHVHGHEFRDLFRTLCDLHGVKHVAAEFMMGHSISSYRKAHLYDADYYRREYQKVAPFLNIISNPPQGMKNVELMKQEIVEQVNRTFLKSLNYPDKEINKLDLTHLTQNDFQKLSKAKLPTERPAMTVASTSSQKTKAHVQLESPFSILYMRLAKGELTLGEYKRLMTMIKGDLRAQQTLAQAPKPHR